MCMRAEFKPAAVSAGSLPGRDAQKALQALRPPIVAFRCGHPLHVSCAEEVRGENKNRRVCVCVCVCACVCRKGSEEGRAREQTEIIETLSHARQYLESVWVQFVAHTQGGLRCGICREAVTAGGRVTGVMFT